MAKSPGLVPAPLPWAPQTAPFAHAFRPYFRLKHPDNTVHQAEMDGDQPVMEWVDDETRAITLYLRAIGRRRRIRSEQAGEP